MTRHTKRIGIWVIAITMLLGIISCGARHAHHLGMDQERIMKRVTKKLDLNTTQQNLFQQVLTTTEDFRSQMRTKHEGMEQPLLENLGQETLDVSAVNAQFEALESDFSGFRAKIVSAFAEFHGSLNPDQREKVVALMERLKKHHKR